MSDYTFEAGKEYRTRDGRQARVYATDGVNGLPLHGATLESDGWQHTAWTRDGHFFADRDSRDDLLPPPPEKVVRYLNIYPCYRGLPKDRNTADGHAMSERIACIRVEFAEGQFDE